MPYHECFCLFFPNILALLLFYYTSDGEAVLCCKATTLALLFCAFKRKLEQNGQDQKAKVEHEHQNRKRLGELPSL
jgi:hypothetical protein